MRLHHLSLRAFGPFAGSEQVDFDELCGAGLFLLTGPTGAGKTTILDAVCFALYGSVPGVRGVKALKSQHAADDAPPEVVLDFSVRGRRFVVRRTPEWTRPKRRGTGLTTENASATLVETTSGEDHLLSSRAQEVGHLVGELIGMQSTQFVQVAMLPQGGFQKFLRASSQDRHDVLQHLFRTDRFSRIEEWVHEHSRTLKERSASGQSTVVRVLDSIADRAGVDLPEDLADTSLRSPDAPDRATGWAASLVDDAAQAHAEARDRHAEASAAATDARSRHREAVRRQELMARADRARSTLADLARAEAAAADAERLVDADAMASRCLPLLRLLDAAVLDRDRAAAEQADAAERLRSLDLAGLDGLALSEPLTSETLSRLDREARASLTRLEALLPKEAELEAVRQALAAALVELEESTTAHRTAAARADALPSALAEAKALTARLDTAARRSDALTLELRQALVCVDAAEEAEACARSLDTLRDAEREARDRAADSRELVQDLTERRLAGIAAELAGQLEDGDACQVCGSTDHPRRARTSIDAVTEAEQSAAVAAYESDQVAHTEAAGKVLQTAERLEALRTASQQQSPVEASETAQRLEAELQRAQQAQADLMTAERTVAELTCEQHELGAHVHDLATRIATTTQTVATHRATIAALATELDAATTGAVQPGPGAPASLSERIDRLEILCDALSQARDARRQHEDAESRVSDLASHAERSATEHGFADVAGLRTAVLAEAERERLTSLLESRARETARAQAVLDEAEVAEVADLPAPDPGLHARTLAVAEQHEADRARVLHQTEETLTALRRHQRRLRETLDDWGPQREEFLRADSMARLVRGMGDDNQLQMRLSAYVLATRLDQVVAAANERLAHMRDQRYLLQRTDRAARRGSQAGLGLEVLDQWTGDVRDPATLSGGETFVVSLSLALGLADVVTHEAGGTEIETLFVDEGFGTLDADTLDDVMDRLDELRAGGRAVGVVSHVSELRNRIPTQLHVDKRRDGSTTAVRTLVG